MSGSYPDKEVDMKHRHKSLLNLFRQLNTKDTLSLRLSRAAFSFNVKDMKEILENHPDWEMMSVPVKLVQGVRTTRKSVTYRPLFIELDYKALDAEGKCNA